MSFHSICSAHQYISVILLSNSHTVLMFWCWATFLLVKRIVFVFHRSFIAVFLFICDITRKSLITETLHYCPTKSTRYFNTVVIFLLGYVSSSCLHLHFPFYCFLFISSCWCRSGSSWCDSRGPCRWQCSSGSEGGLRPLSCSPGPPRRRPARRRRPRPRRAGTAGRWGLRAEGREMLAVLAVFFWGEKGVQKSERWKKEPCIVLSLWLSDLCNWLMLALFLILVWSSSQGCNWDHHHHHQKRVIDSEIF